MTSSKSKACVVEDRAMNIRILSSTTSWCETFESYLPQLLGVKHSTPIFHNFLVLPRRIYGMISLASVRRTCRGSVNIFQLGTYPKTKRNERMSRGNLPRGFPGPAASQDHRQPNPACAQQANISRSAATNHRRPQNAQTALLQNVRLVYIYRHIYVREKSSTFKEKMSPQVQGAPTTSQPQHVTPRLPYTTIYQGGGACSSKLSMLHKNY